MAKIKIKDGEFEVSTVVATAILAERTDKNREIKALKDGSSKKDGEIKTINDSLSASKKELKKIKRKVLRDSVIADIVETNDSYTTKEKNPYTIMADYANIKDEDKRADKAYVKSYFNSVVDANIEAINKKTLKKKKNKTNDSKNIMKKYYKGDK